MSMEIEFEPRTTGKGGREIASRYTPDGSFPKRGKEMPIIRTVGELKEFLSQLPDALPIEGGMSKAIQAHWYNVGGLSEHMEFDDAEDEDDEDFDFGDEDD